MIIGITLTSSLEIDPKYIELTEQVASTLAKESHGIVYGGTAYGMMRKLAETYKQAGGKHLTGVVARDLMAAAKNYKKYELLDKEVIVDTMEERKKQIISLSDAYMILPGGYGTFEEIGTIVGGQANKLYAKPIAFYNFEGYYDTLFTFLTEMCSKRFSKIDPMDLFFASDDLPSILSFFQTYTAKKLPDKFV